MKLFKTTSQSETNSNTGPSKKAGTSPKQKFPCSECGKAFSSKQCLKEHTYKHSNIKPYGCIICRKRFRHASQYTVHKQLHRESQDFYWPVLAEMEKRVRPSYIVDYGEYEKVEIPIISKPTEALLPEFLGFFNLLS
jgi:uncharacterized Zn-finger protein